MNITEYALRPDVITDSDDKIIKAMRECTQNSPHHYGTVLEHTLDAMKYVKENFNGDIILMIATLLHDCGKPYVKAVNKETGFYCFYCHEDRSAFIAEEILREKGFPPRIVERVYNVIKHHDMAMHMTLDVERASKHCLLVTPENIQRQIDKWKLTKIEFQDIIKLCRADVMAQTKSTRPEKLKIIDEIVKNSVDVKFYFLVPGSGEKRERQRARLVSVPHRYY